MSIWRQILRFLGYKRASERISFPADVGLIRSLQDLAEQQQRPETEMAAELLQQALTQREVAIENLQYWHALSEREQQVTALICLGYTNPQIAARLVISPETAKTHVRNVLYKFNQRSKADLRRALADWDFSAWRNAGY
jgi:DNA-binding NarL/FixJ family response regulator